jgi:hypothetical protein
MTDVEATPDVSVLGRLRDKRRNAAHKQVVDLAVPGYDGELFVRYRLLDPLVERKEIADRVLAQFRENDQDAEREYYILNDTLIAACVAIFAKVEGKLVPLAGEGTVTTFEDTEDLADLLAFDPADTARLTVERVFLDNRNAVKGQGMQLSFWMLDPSRDLGQGLFG